MKGLETFNRTGYVPGLRSLVTALMSRSFPKMLAARRWRRSCGRRPRVAELIVETVATTTRPTATTAPRGEANRTAGPAARS